MVPSVFLLCISSLLWAADPPRRSHSWELEQLDEIKDDFDGLLSIFTKGIENLRDFLDEEAAKVILEGPASMLSVKDLFGNQKSG